MEEKVVVEFDLTEKDLHAFNKHFSFNKKFYIGLTLLIISLIALSFISFNDYIDKGFFKTIYLFYLILILIVLIYIMIYPFILSRYVKKDYTSNKLMHKKQIYGFTNEGIESLSDTGTSFIKWSEFYKYDETKNYFYIFVAIRQALIIPKKYLNEQQLVMLRKYFKYIQQPVKNMKIRKQSK